MFLIDSLLVGGLRFVLEKVTLAVDQEPDEARPPMGRTGGDASGNRREAIAHTTTSVDVKVGSDRDA